MSHRPHLTATLLVVAVTLTAPAAAHARAQDHRPPARPAASIIGGSSAVGSTLGMVARVLYDNGDGTGFLCSGTVVASNVVLTAGHCAVDMDTGVTDAASGYQVTTGTQTLAGGGEMSGVSSVIPDPAFDPSTVSGDAALLILATPTTAAPVTLATDPADAAIYDSGEETVITGWGVDDDADDTPSDLLYGLDVVQSPGYCSEQAAGGGMAFDPATQLCAVDAPSDDDGTCHGDSGGPMLAEVDHTWVELGMTSFGPDDCDTDEAGFFTRTDAIASWVSSVVATHPPATTAADTTVHRARPRRRRHVHHGARREHRHPRRRARISRG